MIRTTLFLSIVCLMLSACGQTPATINISAKPIKISIAKPADPSAVKMLPVTFKVVNTSNLDTFLADIKKTQGTDNPVFIAIGTQDYENLALNLADLKRYIEDQKAIIVYYQKLTDSAANLTTPNN